MLQRGDHEIVVWEDLVLEGVTLEEVLASSPAHLLAFVRDAAGNLVTWEHIRQLRPLPSIAQLLASQLGAGLDETTARLLGITREVLEEEGGRILTCGWPAARWVEVFGGVPGEQVVEIITDRVFGKTLRL